ncbi:endothelin-converting enzyme homolog [Trichonephila inaurata madagascariensis]|uniref:Endothelin-converting enzyme homolog n=1 Tax=Trichonephila inaurata madagascariensis TaxID=2747483 RepID=A0A8X6MFW4_9ARAC|nr:endothelin-converting enzyme homolog [Trichonephila inaurata madagascariensis]
MKVLTFSEIVNTCKEDESFELKGEAEKKARTFYRSCINTTRIKELGAQPLLDLLKKIGGWSISGEFNVKDWDFQKALELNNIDYDATSMFAWSINADLKNTTRSILTVNQHGLTLDSRDNYLNKTMDDKVRNQNQFDLYSFLLLRGDSYRGLTYYLNKNMDNKILSAYLAFMTKVGVLLGGEEYATRLQMQDVIEFEIKLAEMQMSAEEQSEHDKLYRKLTVSQLQEVAPFINWRHYFNSAFKKVGREIYSSEPVMVLSLDYLKKLSELVTQYLSNAHGRVTVANYLGWVLVHSKLSKLSQPFRDAGDDLSKAVKGAVTTGVRWLICILEVEEKIGFALSAMFVRETFPPDSKIMAQNMIQEIKEAFKDNFPSLKWMDPETRKLAAEKVDSMIDTVGYPEFIMHPDELDEAYEKLEFTENDYFQNVMNKIHFDTFVVLESMNEAPDRTGWRKFPTDLNAYYDVTANLIGSLYNQYGNLEQWWKNSTIKNFQKQAQCFVEQYSNYEVQGIKVNGLLTLGENIADNGALKPAFNAYQNWVARNHAEQPLPGLRLTNNQLFFVAFGQMWCELSTPAMDRYMLLTNYHSPDKYRVIGSISNSKDFAREFKCPLKSSMNPEKKCEVW